MYLTRRLVRLLIACAVTFVLAVVLSYFALMTFVVVAIAHSGSTGTEASASMRWLIPAAHLVAGLVAGGGIAAITNAIVADRGVWTARIAICAIATGIVAMALPPIGDAIISIGHLAPELVGKVIFKR